MDRPKLVQLRARALISSITSVFASAYAFMSDPGYDGGARLGHPGLLLNRSRIGSAARSAPTPRRVPSHNAATPVSKLAHVCL